ncbi:hypothetical protein BDB00DRAFT_527364 [Zychaea mexicana]|uniref:uncharacterized protein n=1 Tax=Zychaea mexicana TaxID=64656 RepID=UPI0022FF194C|nr:uncharacterized protein BDB00DRAFT_527364 [Zychaea mexicana]KAI9490760.1 hypothetical protein BDB00DRAFT_527364 [Zychaea mexicana]
MTLWPGLFLQVPMWFFLYPVGLTCSSIIIINIIVRLATLLRFLFACIIPYVLLFMLCA